MAMSQYLANKLLDHTVGNVAYTAPATVYMALSTAAITSTGSPTEPVGNGYSRSSVAFATAAANAVIENSAAVTFTATGSNWTPVVSAAIMDASTGGNVLYYNAIPPRTVLAGTSLEFAIDRIRLEIE